MARMCSDCEVELHQVQTRMAENNAQVWEAGYAPATIETWACPQCGQVRFYADPAALFSQQSPATIALTMKEAYGEVLPSALEWSEAPQLCAAYSSGDDEDAFVDTDGLCPYWSFTFVNPAGEYLDLVLVGQVVERSPYDFEGDAGAPFALEDTLDSPDLIARALAQGLDGDAFTLTLERDDSGALRAIVASADSDAQVAVEPSL